MKRTLLLLAATCGLLYLLGNPVEAQAQYYQGNLNTPLSNFYYYPYYYFPHNYWPMLSARWPEANGQPYQRPPAYMAYPPFKEPHWRYDCFESKRYYRGFHFWLDQF